MKIFVKTLTGKTITLKAQVCHLALMSELEGWRSPKKNELYLGVEKVGEKQQLFYRVAGIDEKLEITTHLK